MPECGIDCQWENTAGRRKWGAIRAATLDRSLRVAEKVIVQAHPGQLLPRMHVHLGRKCGSRDFSASTLYFISFYDIKK
jgi:hypothetical protein